MNNPTANGLSITPGQSNTQAAIQARLHANEDYVQGTGACLGAGCGLFGIAGSYLYEGEIPLHRLQALEDKPEMYQLLYRTEYVKETKRMRTKESIGGYILGIAITVVILVALGSTT